MCTRHEAKGDISLRQCVPQNESCDRGKVLCAPKLLGCDFFSLQTEIRRYAKEQVGTMYHKYARVGTYHIQTPE